jgi:hypothetical protein
MRYRVLSKVEMLKVIVIGVIIFYMARLIYRAIQQATPKSVAPVELKACAYCGSLVRVDKAYAVKEQIFCTVNHANQFNKRPQ